MNEIVRWLLIVGMVAGVVMATLGSLPVKLIGIILALICVVVCQTVILDEEHKAGLR